MKEDTGCATIKFIIDSNGRVFNPVAVKVIGGEWYELFALSVLNASTFTPAKSNSRRIPIETFELAFAAKNRGKLTMADKQRISSHCPSS